MLAVFIKAILLALVMQGVQGFGTPIRQTERSSSAVQFLKAILQEYYSNQHDQIDSEAAVVMDDTYNVLLEDDQTALSIQSDECDCCYSSGGCKVCKPPPKSKACKCSYKGFWSCGGKVVDCKYPENHYCKNPDKSAMTCLQGGGDCEGYPEIDDGCDCCFSVGGCKICKTPSKNLACKCNYKGAWTCGGAVTLCKDQNSPHCKNPDKSRLSCLQGGGDCGGYLGKDCNCDYSSNGGCRISTPPPKGKACYCDFAGYWSCFGKVTHCEDPNSPYCKNPDHSIFTCLQGRGDCDGYEELSCDCSYDSTGGCKITTPAPKNYACKCRFNDLLTKCEGSVRICADPNSPFCKNPDTSAASCVQGEGDCDGYPGCNCHDARNGGCKLMVDPAPKNTACKCKKKFIGITEYCTGYIVKCRYPSSPSCTNPGSNRASCINGGGDCRGYQ